LIFEGREVYYSQVFDRNAPRVGDTDLEARELFPYFSPGVSSVTYGKGILIFHWGGKQTIPTKLHFVTNWVWGGQGVMHTKSNMAKRTFNTDATLLPIWNSFRRVPAALTVLTEEELDKYLQANGFPPLSAFA